MTPRHAEQAEHRYLQERVADDTLLELAIAHNAMSEARKRAIDRAGGTLPPPEEPDLSDITNPFVFIAESAKAHQMTLAALIELTASVEALRVAHRADRRERRIGWVLLLLAACAARFLPVAGWSGS